MPHSGLPLEFADLAEEVRRSSEALGIATASTITLAPGEAPEAVDQAEELLIGNAEKLRIYQRAGEVVRIVTVDHAVVAGPLRKGAGTVQLGPVSAINLTEEFDKLATWRRERVGKDGDMEYRRVDCPARIAMAYLARVGAWRLPPLAGVIAAPIMRPDGSILCAAGYDAATWLFLTGDGWPQIPASPTGEDVRRALAALKAPFSEFPFVGTEDRSVLLAVILTALQRRLLAAAPLFGFTAPSMRTGKSLLAEAVGIIATGQPAPAMAVSGDRDEIRKAVASILREGHALVNLDNIDHPLGSPDLARAITQPEYADRILGESRLLRLPTNLLWIATGNNLAFRGDLAVRALLCRLDAQAERPEERAFAITNLKAHVAAHRQELVAAGMTILRAFHVGGRPDQRLPAWGGFDDWSALVRSALVWVGEADPCASRQHVIDDDPDRERASAMLANWRRAFDDRAIAVAEVIERTGSDAGLLRAVLAVAANKADPRQPDTFKLGGWCRREKGKIVDGLTISKAAGSTRAGAWRVAPPEPRATSATFATFSRPNKSSTSADGDEFDFDRGKNVAVVAHLAPGHVARHPARG